jgi:hypothetical protein
MAIKIVAKNRAASAVKTVNVKAKAAEVKKAPSNEIFVSTYTWTDGKGTDHDMVSIAGSEDALQKPGRSFNLSVNNVKRVLAAAKALGLA